MPLYLFRCTACAVESEVLLPLGEIGDRPCPDCGEVAKHRFARVAVKYNGWGFSATDSLVGDPTGKDYRKLAEAAEKISDE